MDVNYIKENLNQDPRWVNKLFREACARFLEASPYADKITVEIERKGTMVYMRINGAEICQDGTMMPINRSATGRSRCRGCGIVYNQEQIGKLKNFMECDNCGCSL